MSPGPTLFRRARAGLVAFGLAFILTGCAHQPGQARAQSVWRRDPPPTTNGPASVAILSLQQQLSALAPTVRGAEAELTARCAIEYARQLAGEYRLVRPPLFHNFLVNTRLKKRGLCFHWAEDLLAQLQALDLATLDLHWGIARAGTPREHNSIVVTARGEPFERGVVLDAWRSSGRLTWAPVLGDKYPWEEGELNPVP